MAGSAAQFSGKSMEELVLLRRRSLDALADAGRAALHARARDNVEKVHAEWERRAAQASSEQRGFAWPSTEPAGRSGTLDGREWPEDGVLGALGYRVGATAGEARATRQAILAEAFHHALPPVLSPERLAEWGTPASVERLEKMARTIASLCRVNKQRRDGGFPDAIRDWEADLKYLHDIFYVGHFGFSWPSTDA